MNPGATDQKKSPTGGPKSLILLVYFNPDLADDSVLQFLCPFIRLGDAIGQTVTFILESTQEEPVIRQNIGYLFGYLNRF